MGEAIIARRGGSRGKKWASGTTTSSSGFLNVSGLGFNPSFVYASRNTSLYSIVTTAITHGQFGDSINHSREPALHSNVNVLTAGGFSLNLKIHSSTTIDYNWIAFE